MILSLLLVSMISKSWAYSFINGFCKYEVISEGEQTVCLVGFYWCNYVPGTDINLSRFVTDGSTNKTYELKKIKISNYSCQDPTTIGTLYIPVSVEKINKSSNYEYSSIIVAEGNPVYDSRNNCNAIIETATNELISGCKNTVIPSSVTSIGDLAFNGCSGLTGISIPSSVTSIGRSAFNGCSSLTTITVDADNPVFDSRNNCNAIIETATNKLISGCKNTVIPSSVTSIGNYAFHYCSGLTGISIPSSVTSIGDWAFSGCFSLTSVTCKSSTPPSSGEGVFPRTPTTSTLYVPVGSRSAYSSTSGWSKFDNIVEAELDHIVSTTDVRLVNDGLTWLAVSLENKKDILGFQFDLTLPSGIIVNTGADGKLVSKLGNRCSGFTQTFTYIGDNKDRVTCLSMQGTAVTGHDGELMRISLTSDREVETGDYDIVLSNIQLTTTEGTATVTIYPEDYNSKLTMLNYALGDIDGNGSITVTDAVMVVQNILYKTPSNFIPETADVNTDGSVNVGDVVSILDLISTSNTKAAPVKALEAE